MSRGLGAIQHKVIAALTKWPCHDFEQIAGVIYETRPLTTSQIGTVSRAIKALALRKILQQAPEISLKGRPCWILTERVETRKKIARAKKRQISVVNTDP